ncbi:MAG: winged helix-turn-helix transcriptional regulator [Clostridiales bacterium]|nr:winged helix-turn-helix transcriptional regulator [Clostridiales bacterium]
MDKKDKVDETLYDLADLFKVFGDSTRLRILYELMDGERCVGELADALEMNQSAVSHQLKVLKQNKLVRNTRSGKMISYALADDHVKDILALGKEHIEEL